MQKHTCRKDARNRYRPLWQGHYKPAAILWGAGAMPCPGIEGDERDAYVALDTFSYEKTRDPLPGASPTGTEPP